MAKEGDEEWWQRKGMKRGGKGRGEEWWQRKGMKSGGKGRG